MRSPISRAVVIAALATPAVAVGADILAQLGIAPEVAREAIGGVISGGVYNPGLPAQAFKQLPPAARVQAVTAGVAWVKAYVSSAEFTRQYAQVRQNHRPEAPAWELTPEQELQKAEDDQRQQREQSQQAIAALPPEKRKAMEDALRNAADLTAKMDTPEARQKRLDAIKVDRAEQTNAYNAAVAQWRQDYPDDPRSLVAKRLREFLQLSADVDYSATLTSNGSTFAFENPAYQAKSSQWKLCYRAGREATAAARAAVQAWLTELGG